MRRTIVTLIVVSFGGWLMVAGPALAATAADVVVEYCHSAGSGIVELGPPATAGGMDYPTVTLPAVSHIAIANGGKLRVTVGGGSSNRDPLIEFDLADKAGTGHSVIVSTNNASTVLGLIIASVDDTGIKVGPCSTPSGFNTIKARVGSLSAIVDGKLQSSTTVLTISSVIGISRLGATDKQATLLAANKTKRIASSAAESVPLPPSRLGPQASDFRLLGYTEYTTIELPSTAQTASMTRGLQASGVDIADAYKNSARTHDLEAGLLLRFDDRWGEFSNPDTIVSLRLGLGGSTLRTKDSSELDGLVKGYSPWFYSAALRFESDYETWGDGSTTRGMLEAGFERYGPFGQKEHNRIVITGALYLPAFQIGTKAAVYTYIRLDFPARSGGFENHRIGVLADVNLNSLFTSGGS